jgi:hypothetical protein
MRNFHAARKQNWLPGALVKVGFLTLRVVSLIPTPGDYRPDVYVLVDPRNEERIYHFTPHFGLERVEGGR